VRLLVIEDEDRLSGILKSKLGECGFAVDIAGSAADATAALEVVNYDACGNMASRWNWRDVSARPSLKPWPLAASAMPSTFADG
jgi:hypothetical protein